MSKIETKFEGTKLKLSAELDSNNDGEAVAKLSLEIDLAEAPDEVLDAIKKKKSN